MHDTALTATTLQDLAGELITPADPAYDTARRGFNALADRRPALIVRAAGAEDVARAVTFAREEGLALAVRGGGHSFAGDSGTDGGLLLDLAGMTGMAIDVRERVAVAQAGLTAGAYTTEAGRHGLATGFGDAPSVGIAGITLGGGMGFLTRKFGLTIDALLGADVVTADGSLLQVDVEHHPDLFWALRGGGGNFGVVTRLRFRLEAVATVLGGLIAFPADAGRLEQLVAVAREAPDELSLIAHVGAAPPAPFIPAEHHGRHVIMVMLVHAGEPAAGERVLARLRALGEPVADTVREMPYPAIYEIGGPERAAIVVRAGLTNEFDRTAAETIVDRIRDASVPMAAAQIRVLGGAMARVASDATAFAHRDSELMVNVAAVAGDPAEGPALAAWADEAAAALDLTGDGAYVNYLGVGEERLADAYPPATLARLREVKRRYDPQNLFRANRNIEP